MSHPPQPASTSGGSVHQAALEAATTLSLALDPAEVRRARAFVRARCQAGGVGADTCDAAVLLTSEVVTNAFLHGRSQARLRVDVSTDAVHVAVSDDNSRHPTVAPPDDAALDGRGMSLVEQLSSSWGVRDEDLGKTIWFTLTEDLR